MKTFMLFLVVTLCVSVCFSTTQNSSSGLVRSMVSSSPLSSYDPVDSKNYVYYAFGAYSNETELLQWACQFCTGETVGFQVAKVSYDSQTDTQAFIGIHPDRNEIVVAFRGTLGQSIQDWIDDVKYTKATATFGGTSTSGNLSFLFLKPLD
eukprot:TRINITY_DN5724_c0_g1_i2.p1 TRINITY_DN5724_c0_g1~~TRINITY_DN5724_c0_g1_i2.p1  ORF type:complete len:151 (-),score=13.12 TRINITY_DN5724_c0_g1_i2:140-592(-)